MITKIDCEESSIHGYLQKTVRKAQDNQHASSLVAREDAFIVLLMANLLFRDVRVLAYKKLRPV